MILNRIVVPADNILEFDITHTKDGADYELSEGEQYYMIVSLPDKPEAFLMTYYTDGKHFKFKVPLDPGRYVFEIGTEKAKERQVLLPPFDDRLQPMNEFIVLKHLL